MNIHSDFKKWLMPAAFIFTAAFLQSSSSTPSFIFNGKVIALADGDTISVLDQTLARKIRLSNIDCPEKKQEFGAKAKEYCGSLCFGKFVQVSVVGADRNKRLLGTVTLPDGRILNEELLKAGMAWVYMPKCHDYKLASLEQKARDSHLGLWQSHSPISPWEWRKKNRNNDVMINSCKLK